MTIRKATKKDIEKINEIYAEGIIQELEFQYPNKPKSKIKEYAKEEIKYHNQTVNKNIKDRKQYWIVLEENNNIIGFGSAYIKGNKGVTESIYIAKEFRGKGYGSKILKNLISWINSKKVKHIETNILTGNEPSIKLHEKFRFKPYLLRMRLR
ncbi:GNAT family N-acetyltransferase [Candidatus Pacearchaeota archaeon]|nr:GNAT family N-acetyltransferase [Candidatus Pacearchaeota archaeon]